jgi:hypothetical protein
MIHNREHADVLKAHWRNKKNKEKRIPPPVGPALRRMQIATASTQLAKFAHIVENRMKKNTSVDNIKIWRESGFGADHFLKVVTSGTPQLPRRLSRIERLKQLVRGSPKLKEIMRYIAKHILPQPQEEQRLQKLLITEDLPLTAWYWEVVLNFLHIPTQTLHSALKDEEREHVVDNFKNAPAKGGDLDHLSVLILMYTINASGVNLDTDCNRVIVSTAASSTPLEVQAWSRVVRVRLKIPRSATQLLD